MQAQPAPVRCWTGGTACRCALWDRAATRARTAHLLLPRDDTILLAQELQLLRQLPVKEPLLGLVHNYLHAHSVRPQPGWVTAARCARSRVCRLRVVDLPSLPGTRGMLLSAEDGP